MAYAPQAIQRLFTDIKARIPQAQLSGIVGDAAHKYGYHRARNEVAASDYSVQLPADKLGDASAASALDVSLPADLMKVCTQRLVNAAKAHDPRLAAVREFCGTLDGRSTYPWQITPSNGSEGVGSWDDSHLWHIHFSFLRQHANDYDAIKGVAEVMAGVGSPTAVPAPAPAPTKAPTPAPARPGNPLRGRPCPSYIRQGTNQYLGNIKGPNASHGGFNASERPDVKAWQQFLIWDGDVPGITDINSGWADGEFEQPTVDATARFQAKHMAGRTQFPGQAWFDDWAKAASL